MADRAGIVAKANISLFWLFGSRNDVVMWLSGWSSATFNVSHKWLARIATVQAIVHSVGYNVGTLKGALAWASTAHNAPCSCYCVWQSTFSFPFTTFCRREILLAYFF